MLSLKFREDERIVLRDRKTGKVFAKIMQDSEQSKRHQVIFDAPYSTSIEREKIKP